MKYALIILFAVFFASPQGFAQWRKTKRSLSHVPNWEKDLKWAKRQKPEEVLKICQLNYSDTVFPSKEILKYKNIETLIVRARLVKNKASDSETRPPLKVRIDLEGLKQLKNLRLLRLDNFDFSTFPTELCELENLKGLALPFCLIDSLPREIAKLRKLEVLDFAINELNFLPEEIALLDSLRVLDLCNNPFREIPQSIFDLQKLERLDIYNREASSEMHCSRLWPYYIRIVKIELSEKEWEKIERINKENSNLKAFIGFNRF